MRIPFLRDTSIKPIAYQRPANPDALCAAYGGLMRRMMHLVLPQHGKMAIHRMLYAAQVLHIARTGEPMFQNLFTAANNGPGIVELDALTSTEQGLASVLDPVHMTIDQGEFAAILDDVVSKLAYMDDTAIKKLITPCTGSAWGRIYFGWATHTNVNEMTKRVPFTGSGYGGPMIAMKDMVAEAATRFPNAKLHDSLKPAQAAARATAERLPSRVA